MALYIDVRINNRVVATARVQNVAPDDRDECDYLGDAESQPFGERGHLRHAVDVRGHDRRKSVWLLVAKIALGLARKEAAPTTPGAAR